MVHGFLPPAVAGSGALTMAIFHLFGLIFNMLVGPRANPAIVLQGWKR
jgi:hypothetical protein